MTITVKTLDGQPTELGGEVFEHFAMMFHGDLLTPADDGYDEARATFNAMIDRRPGLILRCHGTADVVDAVRLVSQHRLLASIRGGGHSVAGHSVHDDAVMIDLSPMRGVWVDPDERIARVQGGAVWADVDRETQLWGLATPGGIVSDTGVAGLTLGGGLGWLRRRWGLACDNLRSVEIVTADGELRHASPEENSDLFWAIRGGGGNFGVVTTFTFDLHPVGPMVYAAVCFYPVEKATTVYQGFRDYLSQSPDEVSGSAVAWTPPANPHLPPEVHGRKVVIASALYAGDPEEGEDVLRPIRQLTEPLGDISSQMPYRILQHAFDAFFPKGRFQAYWKSTYFDELPDPAIDLISKRAAERPSDDTLMNLIHLGGAMSRVGPEESAFGDRSAQFMLSIDGNWEDPADNQDNIAWVRGVWEELQPHARGVYLNFLGDADAQALVRAAYGDNYDRLTELKARYDPENLFRLNANIEPAS